ncbi:hypothetical protein [Sporosarcina sp. Te-1]|uniref:hypothetical protein n=1 Tax=Sporosarcina sp. Te-1 TaxID=2818390 RepID=UPI001A9FFCD9|nr:hypothetical protein [Sporosarcina sp. Te-1]QTD43090.1 hypothetical protein J3U78_10285 [Sporosarcina sp. Te-1]
MSSFQHYHQQCTRHIGKPVVIGTRDGQTHRGIIQEVRNNRVYLQPLGNQRGLGGIGFGWGFGFGFGRGAAFGLGIAIGSIVTLAVLPFFFW